MIIPRMETKILVLLSFFLLPHILQVVKTETPKVHLQNLAESAQRQYPVTGDNIAQILEGLKHAVAPNTGGINIDVLSDALSMIAKDSDIDVVSILSSVKDFLSRPGNSAKLEQIANDLAPMVTDLLNGTIAKKSKIEQLKGSPIERFLILKNHLMNSEVGKTVMENASVVKFIKTFTDGSDKFSYDKFVELTENITSKRHWIHTMIVRMGTMIQYYSNPIIYRPYIAIAKFVINGYLTQLGFPNIVDLNPDQVISTMSAFADYSTIKYLGAKIDSKNYLESLKSYVLQIVDTAKQDGVGKGGAEEISEKLAYTIDHEIIAPIARVNRAYKYLKQNPKCDKYIFCLINYKGQENASCPSLKFIISKCTSLLASCALHGYSNRSAMDYFNIIMCETQCDKYFRTECCGYLDEEIKLTKQLHNKL